MKGDATPVAKVERRRMVGALLFSADRVLLGRRHPDRASHPGVWDMPGGHVDAGERPWDALARELREEIGITPVPARSWRCVREGRAELTIWLATTWSGAVMHLAPDEHAELGWFSRSETRELAFPHPAYPGLIADAFSWVEGRSGLSSP